MWNVKEDFTKRKDKIPRYGRRYLSYTIGTQQVPRIEMECLHQWKEAGLKYFTCEEMQMTDKYMNRFFDIL